MNTRISSAGTFTGGRFAPLVAHWHHARTTIESLTAFTMLGGGSLVLMFFFSLLAIPQIVLLDNVRTLLQHSSSFILIGAILFSYPHFVWSYRFAYMQGAAFIKAHHVQLIWCPLILFMLLSACMATWNLPLRSVPPLVAMEQMLKSMGLNSAWTAAPGLGQLVISMMLVLYTISSGHHYCMQAFGITVSCAHDANYKIGSAQKKLLLVNLYALWIMNILSGFKFFTFFNSKDFVFLPPEFPQAIRIFSYVFFAISLLLVAKNIVISNYRSEQKVPPMTVTVTMLSIWMWLQPFNQPYGYQAWVVPIAHGAQYLYFAYRVEGRSFTPEIINFQRGTLGKHTFNWLALTATALITGYVGFQLIPRTLDQTPLLEQISKASSSNFFLIATFLFVSLHHYLVDAVVWKRDSRAKRLLQEQQARLG